MTAKEISCTVVVLKSAHVMVCEIAAVLAVNNNRAVFIVLKNSGYKFTVEMSLEEVQKAIISACQVPTKKGA